MQSIAKLSNPGGKYRLDQATEFLAVLVERLLAVEITQHQAVLARSHLARG